MALLTLAQSAFGGAGYRQIGMDHFAVPDDELARALDTRTLQYTGRTWTYRTVEAANLVGDAFMTGRNRMLLLERDNLGGAQAVTKRVVEVDLGDQRVDGSHLEPAEVQQVVDQVLEPVAAALDRGQEAGLVVSRPGDVGAGEA